MTAALKESEKSAGHDSAHCSKGRSSSWTSGKHRQQHWNVFMGHTPGAPKTSRRNEATESIDSPAASTRTYTSAGATSEFPPIPIAPGGLQGFPGESTGPPQAIASV
jgi:hypothetical protein